ncbi:MAG: hypothetical protein LBR79_06290 [Oscillospiraceae bacterium]|jgi:hypothetical protein|nr:hypothetical protein [Oscillospiraceae bacterium]
MKKNKSKVFISCALLLSNLWGFKASAAVCLVNVAPQGSPPDYQLADGNGPSFGQLVSGNVITIYSDTQLFRSCVNYVDQVIGGSNNVGLRTIADQLAEAVGLDITEITDEIMDLHTVYIDDLVDFADIRAGFMSLIGEDSDAVDFINGVVNFIAHYLINYAIVADVQGVIWNADLVASFSKVLDSVHQVCITANDVRRVRPAIIDAFDAMRDMNDELQTAVRHEAARLAAAHPGTARRKAKYRKAACQEDKRQAELPEDERQETACQETVCLKANSPKAPYVKEDFDIRRAANSLFGSEYQSFSAMRAAEGRGVKAPPSRSLLFETQGRNRLRLETVEHPFPPVPAPVEPPKIWVLRSSWTPNSPPKH